MWLGGLGRLAAAGQRVFVQEGHAAEGARAGATLVLLHLRVGLQVRSQVGAVGEGSVTVRTGEGTLTGVGPNVPPQQPGSGEGLAACGADTGQRVRADVHL